MLLSLSAFRAILACTAFESITVFRFCFPLIAIIIYFPSMCLDNLFLYFVMSSYILFEAFPAFIVLPRALASAAPLFAVYRAIFVLSF